MISSPRPLGGRARALLCGLLVSGLATTATVVGAVEPAAGAPAADYQMPFPCGQLWTGTTRSYHSPSRYSVDFNRPDDIGDPVVASAAGKVTTAYAYPSGGYGRWIRIDHGDNESTLYAHLDRTAVSVGQSVRQGQVIGYVGTSGNSTGPHLHYEQRRGSTVMAPWFNGAPYGYGTTTSRNCEDAATTAGDVPLAGNMVYNARAELVIFRPGVRSELRIRRWKKPPFVWHIGGAQDRPFLGDWDGDGRMNPGVRTPSGQFRLRTPAGLRRLTWGAADDRPLAGDWDGDGRYEVGLHRPGERKIFRRFRHGWVSTVWLGGPNDVAVTGDWNGDGRTDLGVYDDDKRRFLLRSVSSDGTKIRRWKRYGEPGDLPVVGDWDGDGATDLGVWRPSTATFYKRVSTGPRFSDARTAAVPFGRQR